MTKKKLLDLCLFVITKLTLSTEFCQRSYLFPVLEILFSDSNHSYVFLVSPRILFLQRRFHSSELPPCNLSFVI